MGSQYNVEIMKLNNTRSKRETNSKIRDEMGVLPLAG